MTDPAEPNGLADAPGWRAAWRRRLASDTLYPRLEMATAILTVVFGIASYALLTGRGAPANGVSPTMVTALLVANLLPLLALLALMVRRFSALIAGSRRGATGARMHMRLVALFAGIAAVPAVMVVIFASLLFQVGVQFWFSDRVKTVLDGSNQVAQAYVEENRARVSDDIAAMANDIGNYARDFGLGTPTFAKGLQFQLAARNLTEAAVFRREGATIAVEAIAGGAPGPLVARLGRLDFTHMRSDAATIIARGSDRVEAVRRLSPDGNRYIYVNRRVDPAVLARSAQAAGALGEYHALIERSRAMQWRFNLLLVAVSLLTLLVAVWFALRLANRLVTPIARLATAAERVGAGDLDAQVAVSETRDEISTLARAFNRMTAQLKAQQTALVTANTQLDSRRQFTEAVLTGVSAGVLSIDPGGTVRHANPSAAALLDATAVPLAGQRLADAVPEMAELLERARASGDVSDQIRIERDAETQTLSVRIAGGAGPDGGYVLTFDDISAQLADQRRAAWADVARRIAHEIKNPLTPIQLAAERLQRKYGRQIADDPDTFADLTSTIVRQVGDLRRMVDEFSAFARLPKPMFAPENPERIVRQALVLQEVSYPAIGFELIAAPGLPALVCDRQQLGRALTNVLKNAAESVTARIDADAAAGTLAAAGQVQIEITADPAHVVMTVTDNGLGLPAESRDRLTEPYVTTRAKGTGLGLAIVKKIVEDHGGVLGLADAPGGGARVRLSFSRAMVCDQSETTDTPQITAQTTPLTTPLRMTA